METENHHLANVQIIVAGENQQMLKTVGKRVITEYLYSLKVSLPRRCLL